MSRFLPQAVVPRHFGGGLGLALRVLQKGGSEGRFTLATSLLSLCAMPLDLALRRREANLYVEAPSDDVPMVLVCGPPRCGTTVVELLLARCLGINYLTNFTAVFPRSPVAASRLFGVRPRPEEVTMSSHYGKTLRFSGPNDSLHLWDRWLGSDRRYWSEGNEIQDPKSMRRFFSAWGREFGRPIVTKNNGLNVVAAAVGRELPKAVFICLNRDPVHLAQSLLLARRYIHGKDSEPYGIHHKERSSDPFDDVARQVRFFETQGAGGRANLGSERFWDVAYEDVCSDPSAIIERVASYLNIPQAREAPQLKNQNRKKLSTAEFQKLAAAIARSAN